MGIYLTAIKDAAAVHALALDDAGATQARATAEIAGLRRDSAAAAQAHAEATSALEARLAVRAQAAELAALEARASQRGTLDMMQSLIPLLARASVPAPVLVVPAPPAPHTPTLADLREFASILREFLPPAKE